MEKTKDKLQKLRKRKAYLYAQAIYLLAKENNLLKAKEYSIKFLKILKEIGV